MDLLVIVNPLYEAQASISQAPTLSYLIPLLSHCFSFQKARTRSRLLLGVGIGAGGLKKAGLDQVYRSVSRENNGQYKA